MPSKSTIYRHNNPDNYKGQQERKKLKEQNKYENDPEYRLKKIKQAKERYHRLKTERDNIEISV